MKGYYTGVGSREIPSEATAIIKELAAHLAKEGWILRSGGAQGADSAFEAGCDSMCGQKEIFLPWKGFNGNLSTLYPPSPEAAEIAKKYHRSFEHLSPPAQLLMSRNTHQVLGMGLDTPSTFLVCWTQDGCEAASMRQRTTGGTGQAISIADAYSIPIFNLKNKSCVDNLFTFLDIWL